MLTQLLARAVRRNPDKAAVVQGSRRIGYGALEAEVARCAAGFAALGVGAGDGVALALANAPEFIVGLLAVARLHGIVLPLNPQFRQDEMVRLLRDTAPLVLVADATSLPVCRDAAQHMGNMHLIGVRLGDELPDFAALGLGLPAVAPPEEAWDGPALWLSTSGTTDSYKRVCCTQRNLYSEAVNFVETMALSADDTILCTIPLYHSYGIGNALLDALYLGATLVMPELPPDPVEPPFASRVAQVLELVARERVRFWPGVPHQFRVLAASPLHAAGDLDPVRLCVSSGDVLPRATFEAFRERWGLPVRSLYGSTEAGSIAIDRRPDAQVQFGTLGQPLKNVEIEIRNPDGTLLTAGETGAIWVRSPVIPPTLYDNRPAVNARVFRDGFYDTGDVGSVDAQGFLALTGRQQAFVNVGGYKVDVAEVEEVLQSCPGVSEAAALGVEVPAMGTLVKAVIVASHACTNAQVRKHCQERLAFFKVPRLIERRDALPRSPVGKVLKSELGDVSDYLARLSQGAAARLAQRWPYALPGRRQAMLEDLVGLQLADVLNRPAAGIPRNTGFVDLGLDSLGAIELRGRLEYLLARKLPETLTFDHPTVRAVAAHLLAQQAAPYDRGRENAP
ncbi:AMP-binding protein [Ramlibacter sp. G-1-2-2]|uniref:AMP-binding protein n=1 Tax=Ramlibacter agri TaxID=2728837 RepID=A0A848HA50_9BURK|nr:AMP-binding protein [Ramlibacter agri]NML44488.1 AMP-binding protein [Ramlibacter agri]